jgi:hypothetical protein
MPKQKAKNKSFKIKGLRYTADQGKAEKINFDAALHKDGICE